MIRRPWNITSDNPGWLLFRQPDHAELSAQIAVAWAVPPLVPREEVLEAVRTHDDGWAEWEAAPQVDSHGTPVAFDEMPLVESLAIWNRSIEQAARGNPLVAYAISGHFCRLLERFGSWRRQPALESLAREFLSTQQTNRDQWFAAWNSQAPETNTREAADRAVGCVQLFDAISLWLLGDERRDPAEFAVPESPHLTIAPVETGVCTVRPWPFPTGSLWLSASGSVVPMRTYASAAELQATPTHEVELSWEFRPAK